jgi:transposase InsO family protein
MNVHKNARLTPLGRERIVRQVASGQTPKVVAEAAGVCPRTVHKWVDRYRGEGLAGLQDRSSRPHRLYRPTPQMVVEEIERLRRQRWTGKQIAAHTGVSSATVSRVLRRLGLNKLSALEPAEPTRRYERENPGELIHLDIKKLGRIGSVGHRITGRHPGMINRHHGIGWEFVHVCIDDASRVAFVQIMAHQRKENAVAFLEEAVAYYANQRKENAVAFLEEAVAYYTKLGIRTERVMTDNGSCYRSKTFRAACKRLGLRQIFTKPYTPRTNGKAERFIQTELREWAYARAYQNSRQRSAELLHWLHRYNWHRPTVASTITDTRFPSAS